jgi:hypothetical protein
LEHEIHDAKFRASILKNVETSIGKEDTLKQATSAVQCLSDEPKPLTSCITNQVDFSKAQVSYLVELACGDPDIARGVTRRAFEKVPAFAEPLVRALLKVTPFAEPLATTLLKADCEAVKKLPEDIQKGLRRVIEFQKSFPPSQNG